MTLQLNHLDPAIVTALFSIVMIAGWSLGWWWSRRRQESDSERATSKFPDAIMALFGLLLAFTFSMSLSKYERRREMAVEDSVAIGDVSTCISLLPQAHRDKLQSLLKKYVEHRLQLATSRPDEATLQKGFDEIQHMHVRMQVLIKDAIEAEPAMTVPLVTTLNELTSSHTARVAAVRDRLPLSVLLLLGFSGIFSLAAMGRQQGSARETHLGEMVGFVVLVCFVIWVILDLNDPRRGWITVDQAPMQELLKTLDH